VVRGGRERGWGGINDKWRDVYTKREVQERELKEPILSSRMVGEGLKRQV